MAHLGHCVLIKAISTSEIAKYVLFMYKVCTKYEISTLISADFIHDVVYFWKICSLG